MPPTGMPPMRFPAPLSPAVMGSLTGIAVTGLAALASVGQLLMLPAVWRGGRRLDSWTTGRKVTFTVTVALFVLFSSMLAAWGALEPWNS